MKDFLISKISIIHDHRIESVAHSRLKLTSPSPPGWRPDGRPKKRWMDAIGHDMEKIGLTPEDNVDRPRWRRQSTANFEEIRERARKW